MASQPSTHKSDKSERYYGLTPMSAYAYAGNRVVRLTPCVLNMPNYYNG